MTSSVEPHCQVCFAPATRSQVVRNRASSQRMTVHICSRCGYVEMPENTHDYTQSESTDSLGQAPRCGTEDIPGREFGMSQLGVEVLGRKGLSVLIYGVGRSMDNHHVAALPEVSRVAIGDIMKIRDDAEFVDLGKPATERFDLVVASEVIEHFEDPRAEFVKLFEFVKPDGLLVCSTNIYDGGDLDHQRYIFGRGHVSYYSPESLRTIASANDQRVDFRVPLAAAQPGLRKRYVIFAHLPELMDSVSNYFGRHSFAPSEPPHPRRRNVGKKRGAAARKRAAKAGAGAGVGAGKGNGAGKGRGKGPGNGQRVRKPGAQA